MRRYPPNNVFSLMMSIKNTMPSKWIEHVKSYYRARKAKDASYRYSSAMKDSRASYKSGKAAAAPKKKGPRKRRKKAVV